jgi:hypothetical protein
LAVCQVPNTRLLGWLACCFPIETIRPGLSQPNSPQSYGGHERVETPFEGVDASIATLTIHTVSYSLAIKATPVLWPKNPGLAIA